MKGHVALPSTCAVAHTQLARHVGDAGLASFNINIRYAVADMYSAYLPTPTLFYVTKREFGA